MRVESICIVGGGSAGWMSAALLSHEHPDLEIALIESDNIKPIGVGESTLQHFNRFLKRLELKDEDWMPSCNATYKASIRFKNFRDVRVKHSSIHLVIWIVKVIWIAWIHG